MEKTILDQDIEVWTATVENYTDKLRRCTPDKERLYQNLRGQAQLVLQAMIYFRAFAGLEKTGRV